MTEVLILILQMLLSAGLLLVAILVAAVLSQVADPEPVPAELSLRLHPTGPDASCRKSPYLN